MAGGEELVHPGGDRGQGGERQLARRLEHQPDVLALENLFVGRNVRSALVLGHTRGVIMVAAAREILRYDVLMGVHGYDVFTYPINMDWYSTILFFGTFLIVGGGTLAYMLTVAWKAAQSEGMYTPSPAISRIGDVAIGLIVLWMIQYFAVGLYIWLG